MQNPRCFPLRASGQGAPCRPSCGRSSRAPGPWRRTSPVPRRSSEPWCLRGVARAQGRARLHRRSDMIVAVALGLLRECAREGTTWSRTCWRSQHVFAVVADALRPPVPSSTKSRMPDASPCRRAAAFRRRSRRSRRHGPRASPRMRPTLPCARRRRGALESVELTQVLLLAAPDDARVRARTAVPRGELRFGHKVGLDARVERARFALPERASLVAERLTGVSACRCASKSRWMVASLPCMRRSARRPASGALSRTSRVS